MHIFIFVRIVCVCVYVFVSICTVDFPSQWTIRRLSRGVPRAKIGFFILFYSELSLFFLAD